MSQLKLGAVLSYFYIFITITIAFLYTPIMIRLLGQSEYGLYTMIGSISAYLSIMDLGLGNAIVRYTARNRAIGNKDIESKLNGMFLLLYSIIGILTVLIGVLLYQNLEIIFGSGLTAGEIKKAKIMVIILIINFSLSFPLSIFGSIMQAYERFVIVKLVAIIRTLLMPIITLPFLIAGHGSVTMVLISTIINISCLLYNVYYCFRYLKVDFYFEKIDFPLIKEILGYSFFIFLGIIVDQINWNTGQIILGAITGTAVVAVFAIAIQFVRMYLQFSTSISGLFLPRVTMLVANNASTKELTDIMIRYGRVQYIILAYILTGFILFGYPFILIWVGENFVNAYYMALIIMIPITVPLIQNIGLSILQGMNLQGFRSIVLIMISMANIFISIPLAKIYGGIGVAIGTGVSYVVGNGIIMNIYYHRRIGINILKFWKNIFLMSVPVVLSLLLGYGINYFVPQNNLLFLMFKIGLFSIIYFILMWLLAFNDYEKGLVRPIIGEIKKVVHKFSKTKKKSSSN